MSTEILYVYLVKCKNRKENQNTQVCENSFDNKNFNLFAVF